MDHWIVMPWVNSPQMTWDAVCDCLTQSVPCRVLLVGQGVSKEDRDRMDEWIDAQHQDRPPQVLPVYYQPALPSLSGVWNRALRYVWELGGTEALVVNNDVRLHPGTLESLQRVQQCERALFVSAVGVREAEFHNAPAGQYDPYQWASAFHDGPMYTKGGPDFSCFLLTQAGHARYPFDEAFRPAFFEDLDAHRRYMLGGDGHRIFSVNIPFWHLSSQTVKRMAPEQLAKFERQHTAAREYYRQKWGGLVNEETFWSPFDQGSTYSTAGYASPATPDLQRWWLAHPEGLHAETAG